MSTYYAIYTKELAFDEEVKAQLESISHQVEHIENEYYFLPRKEYLDTFVWVLQNNQIPYRISKPYEQ
jgi:hypothetical protein